MDTEQTHTIAKSLAAALGTTQDQSYLVYSVVRSLDWVGAPVVFAPADQDGIAHWISAGALVSLSVGEAKVKVEYRPVRGAPWRASATFGSIDSPQRFDNRYWMESDWTFRLPGDEELQIHGQIAAARDDIDPDEAEVFAQSVIAAMIGDSTRS